MLKLISLPPRGILKKEFFLVPEQISGNVMLSDTKRDYFEQFSVLKLLTEQLKHQVGERLKPDKLF